MVIGSEKSGSAYHVPLIALICSGLLVTFTGFEFTRGKHSEAGVGAVFALGTLAYFLSELRWMHIRDGSLCVKNVLTHSSLNLEQVALGIRVSYSTKGHHTYTIYALSGAQELKLATNGSAKRAEKTRARLTRILLAGRLDSSRAKTEEKVIAAREQHWRNHEQAALSQVNAYYASGKHRRTGIWIAIIVAIYCLSMGLFMALQ